MKQAATPCQSVEKPLQAFLQPLDNLGKIHQPASVRHVPDVVHHPLDAEHMFAFAVDLQAQFAVGNLEHCAPR